MLSLFGAAGRVDLIKPKQRKCRQNAQGCEGSYWPRNGQVWTVCHNPRCITEHQAKVKAKKEAKAKQDQRREVKVRKETTMTIGARLERARRVFQEWVRLRDAKYFADKGLPTSCIDCGRTSGQFQGGHFITVGSRPELQFHPANCHSQLAQCNLFKSQSDSQYRDNLIAKVGLPMVEYLENYRAVIRWTAEEIEEIRAHYRGLIKELK